MPLPLSRPGIPILNPDRASDVDRLRNASALLFLCAQGLGAAPCTAPVSNYQGYRVGQVRLVSPVSFFSAATFGFDRLAESLALRRGEPFDIAKFNLGPSQIAAALRTGSGDAAALRIVAAAGSLENCDAESRTLDVRYTVYTTIVPPLGGQIFETRTEASDRPATAGAGVGSAGRLLAVPLVGFNQTRAGYGGLRLRSQALELTSAASGNSFTGAIAASEGHLRLTAAYRDVPAGDAKLIQSTLAAGYFGSFRLFRYGASLEGGQQQTAAGAAPYCDLKFVASASGQTGAGAWTAAYGLEIGSTFSGQGVDFAKHILDLGYTAAFVPLPRNLDDRPRFIGAPHHPLTLEARLGAGIIQPFGLVAPAERFFGGNQTLPFIEGGPWDVRGQAFIRSIPENRLGGPGANGFYALNLTLAKAVYARPLLPRELGTPEFVRNLDFAINTAKGTLSDTYLAQDPAVLAAGTALPAIQDALDALKRELESISSPSAPVVSDLGRASRTVASIRNGSALTATLAGTILPRLEDDLSAWSKTLDAAASARILALRQRLSDARRAMADSVSGPAREAARKRADQRAARDFSAAESVLRTVLYELNVYSIAPVAIFDAARVWPSGAGTQYAAGGGARLSLVNVNVTIGYAANPRRGAGQSRGAVFFQLDVSNLFH